MAVGIVFALVLLPAVASAAPFSELRRPTPEPPALAPPVAVHVPVPLSGVVAFPPSRALGPAPGPTTVSANVSLVPIGADYRVTTNGAAQNEISIAVNPRNPRNIVAGANDNRGYPGLPTDYWCGVYATLDGGRTWREQLVPRNGPLVMVNVAGDPSVAFDAAGNAYFSCLGFNRTAGGANVLTVSKSADGGVTWGTAALVVGTVPNVFHDKNYIAVDASSNNTTRGNVYVTWTRFRGPSGECGNYEAPIYISRSTDGGTTFSPEAELSLAGFRCSQGSQPTVGPNGELYVSWMNYNAGTPRAVVAKSTDGGVTFGPKSIVSSVASAGEIFGGAPRTPHFPSIAVNPVNAPTGENRVHVVWTDRRFGSADILMSTSVNGGTTWSSPVKVNDDTGPAAQFFPWVSASATGRVDVVFYDQRDDPANRRIAAYVAWSTDYGATFRNGRAGAQFDPGNYFIGDYIGIASLGDFAYAGWCDLRHGDNGEVYMAGPPIMARDLGRMMNP